MARKKKKGFGPFNRIESLECFPKVKELLLAGRPATRIAKTIQGDFGEWTDIKESSLVVYLISYRKSLSAMELAKTTQPQFVSDAMDKIGQGLDELAELAEIFEVQKGRIMMGHTMEKNLKVLNRTLGNEVRIAAELLRTSHQIKADLGAAGSGNGMKADPSVHYNISSRFGESVARVMSDPSKRTKVLEAAKRAMEAGSSESDDDPSVVPLRRANGG